MLYYEGRVYGKFRGKVDSACKRAVFLDPSCPEITEQMCRCRASGTHDRGREEGEHRKLKRAK